MDIVFNDISVQYPFRDKYDAVEKIKESIKILASLRKQDSSFKLSSQEKITGTEIAPGYYFEQLFSEKEGLLSHNYKTAIKTYFLNFNMRTFKNGKFVIDQKESVQCGYAFEEGKLLFSLRTREEFSKKVIKGKYTNDNMNYSEAKIDNIAEEDHLDIHWKKLGKRIYNPSPKHKVDYGWGSDMDLNDQEAQIVLDKAVVAENSEKHLIAKYKGTYYSFRCHWKNEYHGYQDNSMPEHLKRKLQDIYLNQ